MRNSQSNCSSSQGPRSRCRVFAEPRPAGGGVYGGAGGTSPRGNARKGLSPMFSTRLMFLPAVAVTATALAVGAQGCASQPKSTGFDDDAGDNFGDDSGSSGSSFSSSSGGGPGTSSSSSSGGPVGSSTSSSSGGATALPCAGAGTLVDDMLGM